MNFSPKNTLSARPSILLTAIFILGLALRLYKLDYQSFWHDEYWNISLAQKEHLFGDFQYIPPAYILLLRIWLAFFPLSETVARLPGALIGAGSILVFYFLGKKLFNEKIALLSSLFLAISAIHIDYSQEAKYYSMTLAMAMLMQLSYIRTIRLPTIKNLVLYVLCASAGLYTHYFLVILFLLQAMHLGIHFQRKKSLLIKIAVAQGLALLLFSPVIVHILMTLKRAVGNFVWIPKPALSSIIETTLTIVAGQTWGWILHPLLKPDQVRSFLLFFAIITTFVFIRQRKKIKNYQPAFSFVLLWLFLPTICFYIFSKMFFSLYHIRYLLITILAFYLILAWLIQTERNIVLRAFLAVGFITINLFSLKFYYTHPVRIQLREAAQYIGQRSTDADRIMMQGYFYDSRIVQYYLNREEKKNPVDCNELKRPFQARDYSWIVATSLDGASADNIVLDKRLAGINVYKVINH